MSSSPPFRTSPSTIARYFFHDCERFLYYNSASPEQRRAEDLPRRAFDHSPMMEAILSSGSQWEEEIVNRLLAGRVVVAAGSGSLHTRRLSLIETLHHVRSEPAGRFLYQPTLEPPASFYERFGIDPSLVIFSDNHPDLIAVLPDPGAGRLLRIVDVKRGEALRLAHRIQVALYALELQALLDAEGIGSARVDLDQGAVWLGRQTEPELFDLAAIRPHLERFLRRDLQRILSATAEEAHWHLFPRCEWCEFFEHCRTEMRESNDLSRLELLTTHGKRHLREAAGVSTLGELGRFLRRRNADKVLDDCASLAGQRHRLAVRVAALENDSPQLYGAASPDLPRGENLAVFCTLQQEPLGHQVYLAGLLVAGRDEVRQRVFEAELLAQIADGAGKARPCVWLAERPEDVAAVRRGFVTMLFDVLDRVHRYNADQSAWKDQLTLQVYVHDDSESELLIRGLLEALHEPELVEKATTLLFHFQGPELMQTDRHPDRAVPYPLVTLQPAVSRVLALPVEVSGTLPEALAALGSRFHYPRRDDYHFPLGHGLRADAIHAVWHEGKCTHLPEIRRQAGQHLFAVQALLRSVREFAGDCLVAWPPRFTLPTGTGIRDRLLSRLAFFTRYESLLNCLALREGRFDARPTQMLRGQVIELEARNDETLTVRGELLIEPETGGFPSWLLVRDTAEGRRAHVEYADYWYRNKYRGGPDSPDRAVVGVQDLHTDPDGTATLRLNYAQPFRGAQPKRGERFLLYPRFTDFTTDNIVRFLTELDRQPAGLFVSLLCAPKAGAAPHALPAKGEFANLDLGGLGSCRAAAPPTESARQEPRPPEDGQFVDLQTFPKVEQQAARTEAILHLTPSQQDAYRAIRRQQATAVWGPPGTGKTHFLASAIVALAAAHRHAGRPFRVLVTACTHAAIENLLTKIVRRQAELTKLRCDLHVGKARYWQGGTSPVEIVEDVEIPDWLAGHDQAVLGATVYACLKQADRLSGFDLVVIDEASQVRVPEAAVPISLVAESGRLVLAGDHLQLPPIVSGTYPAVQAGEPVLHRSIFEAVAPRSLTNQATAATGGIVRTLLENFRMNDVLTSVAANLLYGPNYRCVDEPTAQRRLPFRAGRGLDPLLRACLDPGHPLVVIVLEGVRAAKANPVEAELVADLVTALRTGLRDDGGQPYTDDAEFFRRGVFVVSPHRAQIQAIQRQLAEQRKWTRLPFVDTVDKMQGQEADAVIVSYGVADPEFALREAEFIYGLNRLNVALTRARAKSIICLPRPLLDASPQVLDTPVAAAGLAFMRRLVAVAEAAGEALAFEAGAVEAQVFRVARPLEMLSGPSRPVSRQRGRGRK